MTYFVYILYSEKDKGLYTGYTNNLDERMRQHTGGSVKATKHRRPLVLIYHEKYSSKSAAFKRERFLKTKWGNTLKQRVKQFYVNKIRYGNNRDAS